MVSTTNDNVAKRSSNMDARGITADSCESQLEDFEVLVGELRNSLGAYLEKRPLVSSGLVFMAGFYVGWKMKPW